MKHFQSLEKLEQSVSNWDMSSKPSSNRFNGRISRKTHAVVLGPNAIFCTKVLCTPVEVQEEAVVNVHGDTVKIQGISTPPKPRKQSHAHNQHDSSLI